MYFSKTTLSHLHLNLEIMKCLKLIWLGAVVWQHHCHQHIKNWVMVKIKPPSSVESKRVQQYLKCSFASSFSPTCSLCTWTAKGIPGNASIAEPRQTLLLGMAPWRSRDAFTWWESWCPEGNWMAFPSLHHFQETHEPLQSKYFVGCEKSMFAILLLFLLGFECPSLFMASEVKSWLSQREGIITAALLHPTCHPTLKSGNLCREINANIDR